MTYSAPVADLALSLSAAGHDALRERFFPELDASTVAAVLDAAAVFVDEQVAPLNRSGDRQGARLTSDGVVLADGFAAAYQAFVAGGWNSLAAPEAHGGQGLTRGLASALSEMLAGANLSFSLCPMLTAGAIEALSLLGNERQKTLVLPKLVSGEWTGAMCLTEPQAGTDLAALTCRAEPDGPGGYRLTGQKIFITFGDHDATDNICHMVLARLPDAPAGVRGISLFLASKHLIGADGSLGERNSFSVVSLEHKLGIHGSPTCVMAYDGCAAELVGEPHKGLAAMFVMMNAARLQVGVQGVGVAEAARQLALGYARDRRQGATVLGSGDGPIFDHPDVRRNLMLITAKTRAARGICLMTAVLADLAEQAEGEEAAQAAARQMLLVPIAKAWSTDVGVEAASLGLQVHGGMGFIEETGAAQLYRDARITPIYEGTNGVQAIDLIGRKLRLDEGAAMRALIAEMAQADAPGLAEGLSALSAATEWALAHPGADALAGATAYLQLAGDVIGGWALAREAQLAGSEDCATLARFYNGQVLSGAAGLAAKVMQGAGDLTAWSGD
ncbi:acyl-CoA dehydrogenase [Phenylobacterium immobile]|uniref:acyl-CoA dehydrogenase n=1 Tax=Phenylobacterium immobile TaxID=21 RepID=UPI000A494F36|nr:acyl-CoA dehydrogenase [Phenylobacterium immobile]